MNNTKDQTDWLRWWQSAVEKSMKTNADFLNQAWQQYMDLFKPGGKGAAPQDWTSFMENYVKYNTQLADQYMKAYQDWLKTWSDTKTTPDPEPSPAGTSRTQTPPPLELRLSSSPGEKVKSSFNLNNDGHQKQSGLFFKSAFFSYETGEPVDLELKIDPPAVGVLPGQSQQIELEMDVPKDLPAGEYRSQMTIMGFEDASFVLYLEVKAKPKRTKSK